jgi:hypothetical protein
MGLSKCLSYQLRHLSWAAGDGRTHSATLTCIRISRSGIARFRLEVSVAREHSSDTSGGMHAGAEVPVGPDSGGAAARGHERGAVQLLTWLARLPPGACGAHLPAELPAFGARTPVHCTSRCCCVHPKRRLCSSGWHGSMSTTMPFIGAGDTGHAAESHGQHTHHVRGHARHEGAASSACGCGCACSDHDDSSGGSLAVQQSLAIRHLHSLITASASPGSREPLAGPGDPDRLPQGS